MEGASKRKEKGKQNEKKDKIKEVEIIQKEEVNNNKKKKKNKRKNEDTVPEQDSKETEVPSIDDIFSMKKKPKKSEDVT